MATLEIDSNAAWTPEPLSGIEHFRFNVSLLHRLDEMGVFGPTDRVELIGGRILRMTPMGRQHAFTVSKLNRLFAPLWGKAGL